MKIITIIHKVELNRKLWSMSKAGLLVLLEISVQEITVEGKKSLKPMKL